MINSTSAMPSPPQSPTAFQLKTFASSPGSPTLAGSHINNTHHSNNSSTAIALGSYSNSNSPISSEFPSAASNNNSNSNNHSYTGSISIGSLLSQPVTRIVIMLTVVQTMVALSGHFPDHCTSPSQVLNAAQYPAMLASPFVVALAPTLLDSAQQSLGSSILLAISNLVSLALFEERLTTVFSRDGSRIFRNLFLVIVVLVLGVRQFLGFVFSRAVGWQMPQLFFSDSMYECNLGLAPFLFALLVIQALFSETSSMENNNNNNNMTNIATKISSLSIFSIRRIYLQVILCLLNVIPKTIVWWAGSGLIVGFFAALVISYQRRMGRWGGKVKTSAFGKQQWEDSDPILLRMNDGEEESFMTLTKEGDEGESVPMEVAPTLSSSSSSSSLSNNAFYNDVTLLGSAAIAIKERKLSFTIKKAMTYILPWIVMVLLVLIGCNQLHTYRPDVASDVLNAAIEPQTPFLLTLILMTAPRKNGVAYIKETLTSYLNSFPDETADPLYSRIQIAVYTHFTDFEAYDQAKAYFDTIPKARKHLQWIREEGSEKNQRKHLISAIRKIGTSEDTVYLGVMEDDFPFCENGWQEMLNTLYEANKAVPDHCGAFVATGGSGLIFKRSVALTATFILENDVMIQEKGGVAPPPDVSLQNCMLGNHDYCSSCAGTMVVSRTLLQGHLGYNSSTSGDGYHRSQFQCGWRHPFVSLACFVVRDE
ncbi:hypothetical protein EDD11_010152 [Mortierella claussenii]|nr:hypothetical protein EDD11_010152 [Mortierella claussenii]